MKQWESKVIFGRYSILEALIGGFILWIFIMLFLGFLSVWNQSLNPFNSKIVYFLWAQGIALPWALIYVPYANRQFRNSKLILIQPGDLIWVRPNDATIIIRDFFKAKVLEVSTDSEKIAQRRSFLVTNLNTNQSIWVKAKQICVSEKVLDAQPKSLYQQYVDEKGNY